LLPKTPKPHVLIINRSTVQIEVHLGGFPGEVGVGSAEVSVLGALLVDGSSQVQLLDNGSGSEAEVLPDNPFKLLVIHSLSSSVVGVDVN